MVEMGHVIEYDAPHHYDHTNGTRVHAKGNGLLVSISQEVICRLKYLGNAGVGVKMSSGCPAYYDSVLCWPATDLNATRSLACPDMMEGIHYYNEYNVTKHCNEDGEWDKANYSGCIPLLPEREPSIPMVHLKIMYCIYWAGYTLSLVFLALALAIFARYRKLWCMRNIIHSNLILCFALHNITWLSYSLIANEILTKSYGMEVEYCYIPTLLLKYFIAAGFFWMFVEGVFLFVNVMFSFHTRRIRFWMCAIIGWVVPLLLIFFTSIAKSQTDNAEECWNEQYHLDYIFIGPVLCVLMVNVAFLFSIMYVVVTKLQVTVPMEATRYKKAIKALFILCPLLGVNYIFVLVQPSHPLWAKLIFSYYFTVVSSVQGFLVALLFCFRNNEVWLTIRRSARRWRRLMKSSPQSTLRESMRSDTPSAMMVDCDTSSPGRTAKHSVQLNKYPRRQRSCPDHPAQQTTKLRNVVVMNDDGEFRLFLPQSYIANTNTKSEKDCAACRKQTCHSSTWRKFSTPWNYFGHWASNNNARHPTHESVTTKPSTCKLIRDTNIDENDQNQC